MTFETREAWYLAAAERLRPIFLAHGYTVGKIRIGCGWPVGGKKRIGQCFDDKNSADMTYEIFISPRLADPYVVLETLVHELCHAVAGIEAQHKRPFIEVARAIGLVKPWTATTADGILHERLVVIRKGLGPYPHAALDRNRKGVAKHGSRLLKVVCPECGYVVRVTRKWLDEAGPPICPVHRIVFMEDR